jgi:hypothetical protein
MDFINKSIYTLIKHFYSEGAKRRTPSEMQRYTFRGNVMKLIGIIVFNLFISNAYSLDIRSIVEGSSDTRLVKIIDPDKSIFGIPFGTLEDEFIKKYGKPTGYIVINATDTGMLYGKSHFFFFENKKLSGVKISHNIIDWVISQEILANTPFDRVRWKLDNGIKEGMNRAEVKNILGDKLKLDSRGYQNYYMSEKAKVDLDFSHMVDSGDNDEAYHLFGITVRLQ